MIKTTPSFKTIVRNRQIKYTEQVNKLISPCYKFELRWSDDAKILKTINNKKASFIGTIFTNSSTRFLHNLLENKRVCELHCIYYDHRDCSRYILNKGQKKRMLKVAKLLEKNNDSIEVVIEV